jgi:hypothetical protein
VSVSPSSSDYTISGGSTSYLSLESANDANYNGDYNDGQFDALTSSYTVPSTGHYESFLQLYSTVSPNSTMTLSATFEVNGKVYKKSGFIASATTAGLYETVMCFTMQFQTGDNIRIGLTTPVNGSFSILGTDKTVVGTTTVSSKWSMSQL